MSGWLNWFIGEPASNTTTAAIITTTTSFSTTTAVNASSVNGTLLLLTTLTSLLVKTPPPVRQQQRNEEPFPDGSDLNHDGLAMPPTDAMPEECRIHKAKLEFMMKLMDITPPDDEAAGRRRRGTDSLLPSIPKHCRQYIDLGKLIPRGANPRECIKIILATREAVTEDHPCYAYLDDDDKLPTARSRRDLTINQERAVGTSIVSIFAVTCAVLIIGSIVCVIVSKRRLMSRPSRRKSRMVSTTHHGNEEEGEHV